MIDDVCGLSGNKSVCGEIDDDQLSPFLAYHDDYEWPNLYRELVEMMEASIIIYPLGELRAMAREQLIEDKSVLDLPLTRRKVMEIIDRNKDKLLDSKFLKHEFYRQVFQTLDVRNMTGQEEKQGTDEKKDGGTLESFSCGAEIVAFDDQFAKEELVYFIEVDKMRKRITVCFRGSISEADWVTNYEIYMKEVENPMKAHASQEDTIRIHNGFHDYLMEPSSRGVKGPNGQTLSEYQEIIQEHVLPVVRKHPGFKIYVTGHSLGGALATLFAFEAAAEPDDLIPKPVSLFSFASPYVGDESFRAAHVLLEGLGKLRHLRVSNHKDIVTIMPKISFRWNIFDSSSHVGALFKHVGINVRLFEGSSPLEVSYPRVRSGYFTATIDEIARGWDQSIFANFSWNPTDYWTWPQHSLEEYNKRAEANKPSLETLYLNDLYSRVDIVGQLVPQF